MSFLIDTNIISEVRKGARCNPGVAAWYGSIAESDIYLSVLVLGEIRKGVELARARDPVKSNTLEVWLTAIHAGFGERILLVDHAVSDLWGRMGALRPLSTVDGLLAATAIVHGLILVTRNEADVSGLGADVLNPFNKML